MKHAFTALACLLIIVCACWAQDSKNAPADTPANTVTISREEFDALKARLDQLEQEVADLKAGQAAPTQPSPTETTTTAPTTTQAPSETPTPTTGGGRQLLLPEISLVVQAEGKATNDYRDSEKQKLQLTEAELGIQGYVYPNVKADAFLTASPAEHEAMQVEEAYLTYLGLKKALNVYVGEKHVPFGRTNLLHNHSWLYTRQPLVIGNLIASESLAGQGADFSYLLPTRGNLFSQLDVGVWANGTDKEETNPPDVESGPGANMTDRFETARLWNSYALSDNSELELGGSVASGKSIQDPVTGLTDRVTLTGVDMTYRRFGERTRRLLLRGESFWRHGTTDDNNATATGYYLFGNYRWSNYFSLGLLYDWSEFPQNVDQHESAMSLILTKQFSEQYYMRLQAIRGNRPDCGLFNEIWLQWCWGVGPHTHNLE
jgi:hypothetical protein